MIHNVLRDSCRSTPAASRRRSTTAGIDPDRRPQTLAVGEWLALREALGPIGPDARGRGAAPAIGAAEAPQSAGPPD